MPIRIVFIENLKMRWSPVGKVLRHLDKLRLDTRRLRASLVELKGVGKIWVDLTGKDPHQDLVDAFEQSIASNEREMEDLRKALQKTLQNQDRE